MLDYIIKQKDGKTWLETSLTNIALLSSASLNKGTAFSEQERIELGLVGKLPSHVESLDEQVTRAYFQYQTQTTRLRKNIYLHHLHDSNYTVFYKLVSEHLDEMLPVLYTPTVSTIVKIYSQKFRSPRGLYITYEQRNHIEEILDNRTNPEIDIIVATDGEGVLGIGDQGIGGMEIAVAKLMVYTLCGGISPHKTCPIFLDVGTNNQELLDDPMYLGWRHRRISAAQYDEFIEKFIAAVQKKLPNAFIHWEDLGRENAARVLQQYRDQALSFNDDIQGTGAVTLAAILSAIKQNQSQLEDQRIVVYGAGTAGIGIATQLLKMLTSKGLSETEAKKRLWLIDRQGLITEGSPENTCEQQFFAKTDKETAQWEMKDRSFISLEKVVSEVEPTILIGCSGQAGAFHENLIRDLCATIKRPVIMPLSNPTPNAEATPADLIEWSRGQALIATGSPFPPVELNDGHEQVIAQCNNALAFPGIGLGITVVRAQRLSNAMIYSACEALAACCYNEKHCDQALLPAISHSLESTKQVAFAVAKQAVAEGLAEEFSDEAIRIKIEECYWRPEYLEYKARDK